MPVLQANPSVGVFEERTMKQVLIINITRMGDLAQTVPLMRRLEEEWPGVAIDLVIDTRLAPMAALLPGLRHVHTYHFETVAQARSEGPTRRHATLSRHRSMGPIPRCSRLRSRHQSHLHPLERAARCSHRRAGYTRGDVDEPESAIMKNPWLAYCRRSASVSAIQPIQLADLFALGGSGLGSHSRQSGSHFPVRQWNGHESISDTIARSALPLVAVQVSASKAKKTWRPEYFGQTMAALSRQTPCVFVLTGTANDGRSSPQAVAAIPSRRRDPSMCHGAN